MEERRSLADISVKSMTSDAYLLIERERERERDLNYYDEVGNLTVARTTVTSSCFPPIMSNPFALAF